MCRAMPRCATLILKTLRRSSVFDVSTQLLVCGLKVRFLRGSPFLAPRGLVFAATDSGTSASPFGLALAGTIPSRLTTLCNQVLTANCSIARKENLRIAESSRICGLTVPSEVSQAKAGPLEAVVLRERFEAHEPQPLEPDTPTVNP
jgi:hypothetical protein